MDFKLISSIQDETLSLFLYFQITMRLQASDKHHTIQYVIVQSKWASILHLKYNIIIPEKYKRLFSSDKCRCSNNEISSSPALHWEQNQHYIQGLDCYCLLSLMKEFGVFESEFDMALLAQAGLAHPIPVTEYQMVLVGGQIWYQPRTAGYISHPRYKEI